MKNRTLGSFSPLLGLTLALLATVPPMVLPAAEVRLSGVVMDAKGRPVANATIADWWLASKGPLRGSGAVSDAAGRFAMTANIGAQGTGLLAIDNEQKQGAVVHVTSADAAAPVTFRLSALISVRGEYFCPALDEAPAWCNTQVWFTTNRFRIMEYRSNEARFDLRLPPGEYRIDGYGGEDMVGFKRDLVVTPSPPIQDLGRIDWGPTPIGLAAGKSCPAWFISEARGLPTNVTVADFRGRWLLLDFWGYWCGPCIRAMPDLFDLYDRRKDDRDLFEIVAIHNGATNLAEMDQELQGTIQGLWKGRTLPFPLILDAGETTFTNFGVRSYPTQLLIDPGGRVVRDGEESLLEEILSSRRQAHFPLALSRDGRMVAAGNESGAVTFHLPPKGPPTVLAVGTSAVNCVTFSPDGRQVGIGLRDGSIAISDVETRTRVTSIRGGGQPVLALAFSPDGRKLASGALDTTRIWDLPSAKELTALPVRLFPAWSVAFSPDSRKLAAGGAGGLAVWNADTGVELLSVAKRGGGLMQAVAFSPDGKSIAGGAGTVVSLWNADTGKLLRRLPAMASEIVSVDFASSGRTLAALSRGQAVRTWNTGDGRPVPERTGPGKAMRLLAGLLPDDAAALAGEAWAISLRPETSKADAVAASAAARRAVSIAPKDAQVHRALGASLYRAGQFAEAVTALAKASQLEEETPGERSRWRPPVNDVFAALALHRSGDIALADAKLIRVWGRWWDDDNENTRVFNELNEMHFGPKAGKLRALLLDQLRSGRSGAEIAASLADQPQLSSRDRRNARRMLPLATAVSVVEQAREKLALRDRVVRAVETAEGLTPEWRKAALTLARETVDDADALNSASWNIASKPNRTKEEYDLALAQAEAAYRLQPDDSVRNTLGVALYRAGKFEAAMEKLMESERTSPVHVAAKTDLPFLAMAFHAAGKTEEAKKRFQQLVEILQKEPPDGEMLEFLRETEKVLGAKPTVFSP